MTRYDLSDQEMATVEADLVQAVRDRTSATPVALWMDAGHPGADLVRTLEARAFPEILGFSTPDVERRCRFLAIVDLATDPAAIAHVVRISSARFAPATDDDAGPSWGIPMVEEIVAANDGITLDEVEAHFTARGVDLTCCIGIETQYRLLDTQPPTGIRWSDYGYIAVLRMMRRLPQDPERCGMFAHLNPATLRSLAVAGFVHEPFAGRDDLRTPGPEPGTFDDRYVPAFIPLAANLPQFGDLDAIGATEVVLGPP